MWSGTTGQSPSGSSYAACRSPKTYKHLGHGSYEFFVRGGNRAGWSGPVTFKFGL